MPKMLTIKTSLIGDIWGKINHLNGMINISKSYTHKRKTQRYISKCVKSSFPTEQGKSWEAGRWQELKDVLLIKKGRGEACCPLYTALGAAPSAGTAGRNQGGQRPPTARGGCLVLAVRLHHSGDPSSLPRKTGIRMPTVTILARSGPFPRPSG